MLNKFRILLKLIIYALFSKRIGILDDEQYNKLIFLITFGRKANFDHPQTFNEYICTRKVRLDEYDLWIYTDKYKVREYVERTIGSEYLNECYGVYDQFEDIDFSNLPDSFALRGTHGSGYNIIVQENHKFNKRKAAKKFKKWLSENYYYLGREKNYFKIKPRIMCDRFLISKENEGLPEMKVFCFGGKAKFISHTICIGGKTYSNLFDSKWNYLNIRRGYHHYRDKSIPKNHCKIIEVAERLAAPFDFVRVDLYNVDGKIYFSELTFHSGGGFVHFTPESYDYEFAKYFKALESQHEKYLDYNPFFE